MTKTLPLGGMKRFMPAQVEGTAGVMERASGGKSKPKLYRVSASSEYEVERGFMGFRWREKLDHSPSAVQLGRFASGRAPVLVDHETGDQVGVIQSAELKARRIDTEVRFGRSQRAQEIQQDVDDEIRGPSSIGYLPKRARLVEEDEENGDLWLITLWEPVELSLVPVPADPTVGANRAAGITGGFPPVEIEETEGIEVGNTNGATVRDREAEVLEISQMAREYGVELDPSWLERKLTPDQVGREILKGLATRDPGQPAAESFMDGLSARDQRDVANRYSYASAILTAAGDKRGGIEAEVARELEKSVWPSGVKRRGGADSILAPLDLRSREAKMRAWERRTLDTKTGGGASELVFDMPGELIELFRNQAMVLRAGARFMGGLAGNMPFPKVTGAATAHWVPENPGTPVPSSQITTGLIIGSPKTLQADTSFSRQFLVQVPSSGVDGESLVREDLGRVHALAFDYAALHGTGVNGEPLGIYNSPDVLAEPITGVPDWDAITGMIGALGDANAPVEGLAWMTTPLMAAKLMATLIASAAGSDMIWQGSPVGGRVAGYPGFATNQVSKTLGAGSDEHGLILGLWSQLLLLQWGVLELIVDPYAKKKEGLIEVTSFELCDVLLRQPTAFNAATGAKLS
jgi:HK97 family phage major capsid protein